MNILTATIINELGLARNLFSLQLPYFIVTIFILISNIILYFKFLYIIAAIIYILSSDITY